MNDHTTFLRDLAATLESCEWNHPLMSAERCRAAADEMDRLVEAIRDLLNELDPPSYQHARPLHAAMAEACRLVGREKQSAEHEKKAR